MGNSCNLCDFFSCETADVNLSTPIGSCSCGGAICSCMNNTRQTSDQQRQEAIAEEIHKVVKEQLTHVEALMKTAITENINKFGVIPPIHVLGRDIQSPNPSLRRLTVRVNHPIIEALEEDIIEALPVIGEIVKIATVLLA